MKKLRIIVAALLTIGLSSVSFAQQTPQSTVPQAIKYQAVARDVNGNAIANQPVSFRISIIEGSENGTAVYEETQTATTNQFGLANLSIGKGTVISGQFDSIKWGNGTFFAKIEFDPKGGSDYTYMGSSQMLSVPYALYAANAGNMPTFPVKAALIGTNLQAPFDSPQTGMLVYNTDSSGIAPYNVVPGYYYNAGTAIAPNWIQLLTDDNAMGTHVTHDACAGTNAFGCSAGPAGSGSRNSGYGDLALSTIGTNTANVDNAAFGYEALNILTSGYDNTAVGSGALGDATSGNENTAVGFDALLNLSSQIGCVAVGYEALFNTAANYNTGFGYKTLVDNTSGTNNTASGSVALYSNTTGNNNTANGYQALSANTTASCNTSMGNYSLYDNTLGSFNTAVGDSALVNNTTGTRNTAEGYLALGSNLTGKNNTAVGYLALYSNTGSASTAVGDSALYSNTSGLGNSAFGHCALYTNSTGNQNTALGTNSLFFNTTGYVNVAIGSKALRFNTTGFNNTAVGYEANSENTTGEHNTSCGHHSLLENTSGRNNSALGDSSLSNVITGSDNTAIGRICLTNTIGSFNTGLGDSAGYTNTSGTDNVFVGYWADATSSGLTNAAAIGNTAQVCSSNSMVFGNSSVTTWGFGECPSNCNANAVFAVNTNGGIYMDNSGNWHACSDRNKKENFTAINGELLLRKIDSIPITRWNYKCDPNTIQHIGPMAQDFYKVFHVGNDSLSISTLDPGNIALAGVQALNRKLEVENEKLKTKISEMAIAQAEKKTNKRFVWLMMSNKLQN
jgi:hypothetical protein